MVFFSGIAIHLLGQSDRLSKKELRKQWIDSVFSRAESDSLDTQGRLRYVYSFTDESDDQLVKLSKKVEKDSFETILLESKRGDEWRLVISKEEILSRVSMLSQDKRMRSLAYYFIVRHYDGFSISKSVIHPLKVPDEKFGHYLNSLDNETLFFTANYLFRKASYNRSALAFKESILRRFKEDTSHYQIGNALIATNELVHGIEHWEAARNLNPKYLEAYLKLGIIFYENAHFNRSLYNFMKADAIDPDNDVILYHLSETLFQLGRYDESYTYAQRSLNLNRKNVFAKGLLDILDQPAFKKLRKSVVSSE